MVKLQKYLLMLAGAFVTFQLAAEAQKFLPDDPIETTPPPLPVASARNRNIDEAYDFLLSSAEPDQRPAVPAMAINTLGEVPDSPWFAARHGRRRLSRRELQQGAQTGQAPAPPFRVVGGKTEGISPGFRMRDAAGRLYFVKTDPRSNPEMTTGSEIVVSNFLYAIGYNTPENYLVYARHSDLVLAKDAQIKTADGKSRRMTKRDFDDIVERIPRYPDGSIRLLASLAIEGDLIGPFRYEGTRRDDPNDTVPHEMRRDLRGLAVFSAWLNHTDMKPANSLDTIVTENGTRFIRHYLLDFGSALGSDGDRPKDPRFGHEFIIPKTGSVVKNILGLGLFPARWERARFPDLPAVGNLDSESFEPDRWKTDYPNPAFLSRLPDDEFWAAKQIITFTDDDIRAIVETGRFSDRRVVDYLTTTLAERRDKIARTYFSKVLPVDNFRVAGNELQFDDLSARPGLPSAFEFRFRWFAFDNLRQEHYPLASTGGRLPLEFEQAAPGSYASAVIDAAGAELKPVVVYLRKEKNYRVVGIERGWPERGIAMSIGNGSNGVNGLDAFNGR